MSICLCYPEPWMCRSALNSPSYQATVWSSDFSAEAGNHRMLPRGGFREGARATHTHTPHPTTPPPIPIPPHPLTLHPHPHPPKKPKKSKYDFFNIILYKGTLHGPQLRWSTISLVPSTHLPAFSLAPSHWSPSHRFPIPLVLQCNPRYTVLIGAPYLANRFAAYPGCRWAHLTKRSAFYED